MAMAVSSPAHMALDGVPHHGISSQTLPRELAHFALMDTLGEGTFGKHVALRFDGADNDA
jgi:hypothetical protein